jgi:TonB family protein
MRRILSFLFAISTAMTSASAQPQAPQGPLSEDKVREIEATNRCDVLYPEGASNSATTYLVVRIDASSGHLSRSAVLHSSGDAALDAAAVSCANHQRIQIPAQSTNLTEFDWIIAEAWGRYGRSLITPNPSTGRINLCSDISFFTDTGTTLISFRILNDGTVTNLAVAESSGSSQLDAISLACVRNYRYYPAFQNGHPVELDYQVAFSWKHWGYPWRQ